MRQYSDVRPRRFVEAEIDIYEVLAQSPQESMLQIEIATAK